MLIDINIYINIKLNLILHCYRKMFTVYTILMTLSIFFKDRIPKIIIFGITRLYCVCVNIICLSGKKWLRMDTHEQHPKHIWNK